MNKKYRAAIIGSRSLEDYEFFCQKLSEIFKLEGGKPRLIISGGAMGTDSYAELYARENGIKMLVIRADWLKYGISAGPIRNSKILQKSDLVIAFWDYQSPGTADTIKKAIASKITVYIINIHSGEIQLKF